MHLDAVWVQHADVTAQLVDFDLLGYKRPEHSHLFLGLQVEDRDVVILVHCKQIVQCAVELSLDNAPALILDAQGHLCQQVNSFARLLCTLVFRPRFRLLFHDGPAR